MTKINSKALSKLNDLLNNENIIKINKYKDKVEITIWKDKGSPNHIHIEGSTLVEALLKIKI